MWKKEKPVRLHKKISLKEKIQKWINKHKLLFIILGFFLLLILFVVLIMKFAPGTESGNWYNGFQGVI